MTDTWVFEFYNLYIPIGSTYENPVHGFRIEPLDEIEKFEENRKGSQSEYNSGLWRTAKVYVDAEDREKATEIATEVSLVFSFAQKRNVIYSRHYKEDNPDEFRVPSLVYPEIGNDNPVLINTTFGRKHRNSKLSHGFTCFLDRAFHRLREMTEDEYQDIYAALSLYEETLSTSFLPLTFLLSWFAIERLANSNYHDYLQNTGNHMFTDEEKDNFRDDLKDFIDSKYQTEELSWKQKKRLKDSLVKNFLYEHSTEEKIRLYVEEHLNLDVEGRELRELIKHYKGIRSPLVHHFRDDRLIDNPREAYKLQKVLEDVILRELGVDHYLERTLHLKQMQKPRINFQERNLGEAKYNLNLDS